MLEIATKRMKTLVGDGKMFEIESGQDQEILIDTLSKLFKEEIEESKDLHEST